MPSHADYLDALEAAILINHKCKPTHRETAFVHVQTKDAETVWKGQVEVFDLAGHKETSTCYAWHNTEKGSARIFAILKNNFIDSPRRAVEAAILADKERPTPSGNT
ncbi:MAG TPA: hypothetical protein VMH87_19910 [Pseudomonadales bacterium]|nr:hypothetical protein [Pseudomonadales bacterium]